MSEIRLYTSPWARAKHSLYDRLLNFLYALFFRFWPEKQPLLRMVQDISYCNRVVFEVWLEQALLPILQPGQVIICDNAAFHKGGRIEALIKQANCQLLYLPPYSPDLNPIEHQWFVLKNRMRKQIQSGQPFRQVVDQAFVEMP